MAAHCQTSCFLNGLGKLRNTAGCTRDDHLAEVLSEGIWSAPGAGGSSSGHPGARHGGFLP